MGPYMQKGR